MNTLLSDLAVFLFFLLLTGYSDRSPRIEKSGSMYFAAFLKCLSEIIDWWESLFGATLCFLPCSASLSLSLMVRGRCVCQMYFFFVEQTNAFFRSSIMREKKKQAHSQTMLTNFKRETWDIGETLNLLSGALFWEKNALILFIIFLVH